MESWCGAVVVAGLRKSTASGVGTSLNYLWFSADVLLYCAFNAVKAAVSVCYRRMGAESR